MLPQNNDRLHDDRDGGKAIPQPNKLRRMTCPVQLFRALFHRRFHLRNGGLAVFQHLIKHLVLPPDDVVQVVVQHLSGVFFYALTVLLLNVQ